MKLLGRRVSVWFKNVWHVFKGFCFILPNNILHQQDKSLSSSTLASFFVTNLIGEEKSSHYFISKFIIRETEHFVICMLVLFILWPAGLFLLSLFFCGVSLRLVTALCIIRILILLLFLSYKYFFLLIFKLLLRAV